MRLPYVIRAFVLLVVFAFVGAQAHATQHVDDHHDHDGISCADALTPEIHAVILPEIKTAVTRVFDRPVDFVSAVPDCLSEQARPRAPPPRGPPA